MPISDRTLAEMEAGAKAVGRARTATNELPTEYMAQLVNTQRRAAQLRAWEKEGFINIEIRSSYKYTTAPDGREISHPIHRRVVHCGDSVFDDELITEQLGGWPSEELTANVALAVMSGEHNRKGEK